MIYANTQFELNKMTIGTMFTKRFFATLFALLTTTLLLAQNITKSDSSGRVKLGINLGVAFQRSDIRSTGGGGLGLTLEWAIIQNNHTFFGLSIRGRYLYSETYGKDFTKFTGLQNNGILNGQYDPTLDYNSSPGYAYMNYKTKAHDVDLELMLIANKLRQKGILLYGFGGIGFVPFRTYYDQLGPNGQKYDYTTITGTSKSDVINQLDQLRDRNYETSVNPGNRPITAFAPSFGAGFGFFITPYVSWGIEHKVTLPNTDLLDGQKYTNNNNLSGNNDVHHYTNLFLRIDLGRGGHGRTYTNSHANYQSYSTATPAPDIKVNYPTVSPANSCTGDIQATISHVDTKDGIRVYQDGNLVDPSLYNFNALTGNFTLTIPLQRQTTFAISAHNSSGIKTRYVTFNCNHTETIPYHPTVPAPIVRITSPAVNPYSAPNCNAQITASISNVTDKNKVEVVQNGLVVNPSSYSFNSYTGQLSFQSPISGPTTFIITATNEAGKASSSVNIDCEHHVPGPSISRPQIVINRPYSNFVIVPNCVADINATIINITSKFDLEVRLNGMLLSSSYYSYNQLTKIFQINYPIQGVSNFTITASNPAGIESATVAFRCEPPVNQTPVIPRPVISVTNPMSNPYITSDCKADVTATILNINGKNNIEVRDNGAIVNSSYYTYDYYSRVFRLMMNVTGVSNLTITASNNSGVATSTITLKCEPIQNQTQAVPKPIIAITSPTQNPYVSLDCKGNLMATIANIDGKQNLEVRQNGQIVSSNLYDFDPVSRIFIFHTDIKGVSVYTITAANVSGTAQASLTMRCEPPVNPTPIQQKPVITITNPTKNPFVDSDCKSTITATIININGKEDIEVRQNGQVIPGAQYSYDAVTKTLTYNSDINQVSVFTITAVNNVGTATASTTIKCEPKTSDLPAPPAPTISISSPTQNPFVTDTCNATVVALVDHIDGKQNLEVKVNGQTLSSALYTYDVASKQLVVKTAINGVSVFTINVANATGTATATTTIKCQPKANEQAKEKAPTVTITSPTQNPFVSADCKADILAKIENITSVDNIEVKENGAVLSSALYRFDATTKVLEINTDLQGVSVFTITATNSAGVATATITVKCDVKKTNPPVVLPPVITVTSPTANPFITEDCKAAITATITNIDSENNIEVRANGQTVSSALYHFDGSSKIFTLTTDIKDITAFTISAANSAGATSAVVTVKCQPKNNTQPVIQKPVITITSPAQNPFVSPDCKAGITGTITNINSENNIEVRKNGQLISSALYSYDTTSHAFALNTDISEVSAFTITAANAAGSASTVVTIKCQPKTVEQPVVPKPVVTITNPTQNPYVATDCKAAITATILNIDNENSIEVRQNGQIVSSALYHFDPSSKVLALNTDIKEITAFTITAANSAGSASAGITIRCTPKVDVKPVVEKPVIAITNPTSNPFTYSDCKAVIAATVKNIDSENNIEVKANGQVVSSALYTYDTTSNVFNLGMDIKEITAFTITAANSAGIATAQVTIKCTPKVDVQPTVEKPVVTITSPTDNFVATDCKATVTATIKNIEGEKNIEVRQNGQVVSENLYTYDVNTKLFSLSSTISEITTFSITAANSAGTGSDAVTIKCAPKPVVPKPVITIVNPKTTAVVSEDCKASIVATIANVEDVNAITVNLNGNALSHDQFNYDGSTKTLTINDNVKDKSVYQIAATNESGTDQKSVSFTCQPKVETPVQTVDNCGCNKTSVSVGADIFSGSTEVDAGSSSITVNNGDKLVIAPNQNFTGSVNLNGGSLIVVGKADINSINFNGGELVILGSATFSNLNANSAGSSIRNYGSLSLGNFTFNGTFENHGTTAIYQDFNVNASATFKNTGVMNISGNFNNNSSVTNQGIINVSNKVQNNGSANFSNGCRLVISNELVNNSSFNNSGTIVVSAYTTLNSGRFAMNAGSKIETGNLTVNAPIVGDATNCSSIKVGARTILNSGASLSGKVEICDANGIDQNAINYVSKCLCIATPCNNGIINLPNATLPTYVAEEKITICHFPPGNTDNPQTITIGKSALQAHLDHGDQIGSCDNTPVTICHMPPGNPGNAKTLTIPNSAVKAHLAHGDKIGPCEDAKKDNGNNGNGNGNNGNGNNNSNTNGDTNANPPATEEQITICHFPPGNTDNPQTITIGKSALQAHLDHGDQIGSCDNTPVTICHMPPGNPGNAKTLTIPNSAVKAHLAHGDKIGPCEDAKKDNGNNGNGNGNPNTNGDTNANPPATEEQITICHFPPGNTDNPQTITIGKSALQAHLDHGDQIGSCDNTPVTICHMPPGNPGNAKTLTIPNSAVKAHLAHGDKIGPCEDAKKDNGNNGNGNGNNGNGNNNSNGNSNTNGDTNANPPATEEQITICHFPPGNTDNPQTITIGKSALQTHLDHGDQIGSCDNTPVTICHMPPGNPGNAKTLTIPNSAVKAHLAHGDKIGPCDDAKKDNGDNGNGNGNNGNGGNKGNNGDDGSKNQNKDNGGGNAGGNKDNQQSSVDDDKITICHLPPGNQSNPQTLTISKNALKAHLDHGDIIGTCDDVKKQQDADQAKQKAEQDRQQKEADDKAKQLAEQDRLQKEADEKAKQQAEQDRVQKEAQEKARQQTEQDRLQKEADDKTKQLAEQDRLQKEADEKAKQQAEQDRLQKEADDKAKQQAEQDRLQKEADDKAKQQAEQDRLQREADEKAKQQAEQDRLQREADEKAKQQAEQDRLQREADEKAKQQAEQDRLQREADEKAKQQAEQDRLQKEADEKARQQAEQDRIQKEADEKARQQAEQDRLQKEADEKARQQAEQDRLQKEADEKARQQAEQDRLQREAQERARQQAEQDRLKKEADEKARQQAEQDRLKKEADEKAKQQAEQDKSEDDNDKKPDYDSGGDGNGKDKGK